MGQPLSEKRKELARKYIESEGVNEPVLEELNRLMKPLYYYCIGDYYKSLPLNDIDDFTTGEYVIVGEKTGTSFGLFTYSSPDGSNRTQIVP